MAEMKDFNPGNQNALVNSRHRFEQYALRYMRGLLPLVVNWPTGSAITYGSEVGTSTITGGSAQSSWGMNVPGRFEWVEPEEILDAGTQQPAMVFIPDQEKRFATTEGNAASMTVNPRPINVTAANASKTYGAADPTTFGYNYTGELVGEDAFSGSLARQPGSDAGHYTINIGSLTLGPNYAINFTPGTFTINQASPAPIFWPTANPINQGQTLANVTWQTSGGAAVSGSFQWFNSATQPIHSVNQSIRFVPDSSNYQTVSGSVYVRVHRTMQTNYVPITNGGSVSVSTSNMQVVNASVTWQGVSTLGPIQSTSNSYQSGWFTPNGTINRTLSLPALPSGAQFYSQSLQGRTEATTDNQWHCINSAWPGQSLPSGCLSASKSFISGYTRYTATRGRSSYGLGNAQVRVQGHNYTGGSIRLWASAITYYQMPINTQNVSTNRSPHNGAYDGELINNATITRAISLASNANNVVSAAIGGSFNANVRFNITYYTTG
jgi:hypothetical protein